jgi:hypothetical protein
VIFSVAVSFVGLALAAHPISKRRETDHAASVRNVYEQRNRALALVQSASFLTGSSGTGLFILASGERAGVLQLGVPLCVVFLVVVLFAYAIGFGHVTAERWSRRVDGSENTGTGSPDD